MNGKTRSHSDVFSIILRGCLVAGTLDAIDAVVAFEIFGVNPVQVLQYVASGLQGKAAFAGNTPSGFANAALGALLHYFIAFVVAAVYYAAALRIPALVRKPVRYGLLYGASVYLFMNYLVLPFSVVAKSSFSWGLFLNGIIGHALLIGLPIALFTARPRRSEAAPPETEEHSIAAD